MRYDAIETRYAGCRFRSRLEARWAVFFDTMRIRWEYEPQGLKVRDRLWGLSPHWSDAPERNYLPDFWLPEQKLWVEVKGALDYKQMVAVLQNAAFLSSNNGAGCHDSGGNDLVLLGPIPDPRDAPLRRPVQLHLHKGDLEALPWEPFIAEPIGDTCPFGAREYVTGDCEGELDPIWHDLLDGLTGDGFMDEFLFFAYEAARSARFEWGESG